VPRRGQERIARWTSLVFVLAALFSLVTLPVRRQPRLESWVDVLSDIFNVPLAHTIFGVVLLFLLTGALLRRKRFALWIVVAVQATGIIYAAATASQAVSLYRIRSWAGLPGAVGDQIAAYLGGVFGVAAVVGLVWARPAFPARRSPGSLGAAIATFTAGMAVSIGLAIGLTALFGPTAPGTGAVGLGLRAALDLDAVFPPRPLAPHLPPWVSATISVISALVVVAAVAVFLRSGRGLRPPDPRTELEVRTLLSTAGHQDSLGYFATRRDKSVVTSPDGRAAIGYRVIASVSLAAADPIGDVAAWPGAIDAWLQQARTYGWVPAALSPGREAAQAYVTAGLQAIPLGDEAILDTARFTTAGPAMKAVRQAVVRAERAGYTVSIRRHADIEPQEMAQLAGLADRWRGDAPERGFSMALSRLGDPADGACVMVVAHGPDGSPAGLLSLVPWGADGLSLDLMRRDRDAVNGVVELMVTTLLRRSEALRIRRVSLNFAMFRAVFAAADEFGAGPITRLNNAVLGVFGRFFQLESLYRSNAKYQPTWVTRYLCIDSVLSLPRIALAAGMAEGFLPHPGAPAGYSSPPWLLDAIAQLDEKAAQRTVPEPHRPEQERIRRDRLAVLQSAGLSGYPVTTPRTGPLSDVLRLPDGSPVSVAGRVHALRDLGGVAFATLAADGCRLQLLLDRSETGPELLALWRRTVDRGDIVSATGCLGVSKTGERSLIVQSWTMAGKALRPLAPAPGGAQADSERRVRDRSAELITDADAAAMMGTRNVTVNALRSTLRDRGFLEVETPILHPVHGGATARPFVTHFHAYSRDVFLRIAPELFLKRLVVGGTGAIFEIGRCFRNEGVDATHNPEFTSLEAYLPFSDYHDMRRITEEMLIRAAVAVHGSPVAMRPGPDGRLAAVDISAPWPVIPVHRAVSAASGEEVTPDSTADRLQMIAAAHGIEVPDGLTAGEIVVRMYEHLVEPETRTPVFYTDFPVEDSPLARPHRDDPRLSERWDLVAFGMEIGTAYSELTDPIEQRARLTEQSLRAAAGDVTAMEIDEDFLSALELGMPPTGGLGVGVDRVTMMLTGTSIRSVLAFPFVRPLPRP
jgi:lysyl-tRNA synthetase class 2